MPFARMHWANSASISTALTASADSSSSAVAVIDPLGTSVTVVAGTDGAGALVADADALAAPTVASTAVTAAHVATIRDPLIDAPPHGSIVPLTTVRTTSTQANRGRPSMIPDCPERRSGMI